MAVSILAEAGAAVATVEPPSYEELLNALVDLTFDPSNVSAQQHAQQLLARVPAEVDS